MKIIKSIMDWLRGLFEETKIAMSTPMIHDGCDQCLRAARIENKKNRVAVLNNLNLIQRHGYNTRKITLPA